ncbi:SLC13 family permease [Desulfosediminicola sp.]|uniref:SLC13 family permease n=1 Tax=Desulfosediminicola sp. TaxID=2886825 RepID=UPI003AF29762
MESGAVQEAFAMDASFWVAIIVFTVALVVIISEKIHKTVVAIFGAALILVLKILDQHEAFHLEEFGVDWNVIFLLVGMMIIISLMRPTGMFEYIAIRSAKLGRGDPLRIMIIFAVITAAFSALLDNVTTVLLLAPVTLLIADALEVDAIPFLIVEALSSNIGGTATLIGDPPNIMIASRAKLNFMDFIIHLAPIIIVIMVCFLFIIRLVFANSLKTREELKQRIMNLNEADAIKDPLMLKKSLCVLGFVLLGFMLHGVFHYEPATVALFGAGVLLLLSGTSEPQRVLAEVEWQVIFFFIGLFIMVGGLVKVGAIKMMSTEMLDLTRGDLLSTSMLIMWFSAIASAVIDNIPYVATMNPLVIDMAGELWPEENGIALLQHPELMPIWWSLALGSCLGGNGSPIGASANVIIVEMAGRAGQKISFLRFMAYGVPVTIVTVFIAMIYVYLRYYAFA